MLEALLQSPFDPEFIPFVFLGTFGLIVAAAFAGARRQRRRWAELGPALGLVADGDGGFFGPRPQFRGSHGAFDLTLRSYTTGAGRSKTTWTSLDLSIPGIDRAFWLEVSREGLGARIAKRFGGQDVEVGNPPFDERFRVKASNDAMARAALTYSAQQAILALDPEYQITLVDGVLAIRRPRFVADADVHRREIYEMGRLAEAVQDGARASAAPSSDYFTA